MYEDNFQLNPTTTNWLFAAMIRWQNSDCFSNQSISCLEPIIKHLTEKNVAKKFLKELRFQLRVGNFILGSHFTTFRVWTFPKK